MTGEKSQGRADGQQPARSHRDIDLCLMAFWGSCMGLGTFLLHRGVPFAGRSLSYTEEAIVLGAICVSVLGMVLTSLWMLYRQGLALPANLRECIRLFYAMFGLLAGGFLFYLAYSIFLCVTQS